MRILFLFAILAAGLFYSYHAFATLNFLTSTGRLGPGFFPRIIGTGVVALTLVSIAIEARQMLATPGGFTLRSDWFPQSAAFIIVLCLAYVVSLRYLGGLYATIAFLLVTLSLINRGRHVTNLAVSVLVPLGFYILFKKLLNASFPAGILPVPF